MRRLPVRRAADSSSLGPRAVTERRSAPAASRRGDWRSGRGGDVSWARGSPGREKVRPRKSESCCPRPVIGRRRPHLHALCPLTIHTCRANTSSIHQHDTIKRRASTPRARPAPRSPNRERQAAGESWAADPLSSSRSVGARMKTSHMMSGPCWLPLMNPITSRPVAASITASNRSRMRS